MVIVRAPVDIQHRACVPAYGGVGLIYTPTLRRGEEKRGKERKEAKKEKREREQNENSVLFRTAKQAPGLNRSLRRGILNPPEGL